MTPDSFQKLMAGEVDHLPSVAFLAIEREALGRLNREMHDDIVSLRANLTSVNHKAYEQGLLIGELRQEIEVANECARAWYRESERHRSRVDKLSRKRRNRADLTE